MSTQNTASTTAPAFPAGVISPDEAVEVLRRAVKLCPEITVAGIAGPGDTLATSFALETFRRIRAVFPDILRCMSTNGLLLSEKADEVIEAGVDTLTVTVNAVDPEILEKINGGIVWEGKLLTGRKAAEILIENQLKGIERVAQAGITVKVNTVLIILALNQNTWRETWRHNTRKKAEKMAVSANFSAGVSRDTEHLYLTKTGLYAVSPGYGPLSLVPVGVASNMAVLGGWPAGSVPYNATLKNYGMTNPYRDCVNNEKVYLIDNDINLTLNYIREYYDMDAQAVEVGKFDEDNVMYQIVSEKKE